MAIGAETAVCPDCGLRLDQERWSAVVRQAVAKKTDRRYGVSPSCQR